MPKLGWKVGLRIVHACILSFRKIILLHLLTNHILYNVYATLYMQNAP